MAGWWGCKTSSDEWWDNEHSKPLQQEIAEMLLTGGKVKRSFTINEVEEEVARDIFGKSGFDIDQSLYLRELKRARRRNFSLWQRFWDGEGDRIQMTVQCNRDPPVPGYVPDVLVCDVVYHVKELS